MQTHQDIIGLWPTLAAFADDLGENYRTVQSWKARDSIPADAWLAVSTAAASRGLDVTLETLAQAKARAA